MSVVHFNQSGFDAAIPNAPFAMIDFWASWCGPCRMLGPIIDQLGQEYEGKAIIGKVNVDEESELARRYGVMTIPTVIFFKNGQEVERKVGVMPAEVYKQVLDQQ